MKEQFKLTFQDRSREYFHQGTEAWYQRTHRLREFWQDTNQNMYSRCRALALWHEMYQRMQFALQVIIQLNTPKAPLNFPAGGILDVHNFFYKPSDYGNP